MTDEFDGDTNLIPTEHAVPATGAEIVVVEGPDRGLRARLTSSTMRIGTAEGSTLRLADSTVSRLHCEIVLGAEGIRLSDAGSRNGTYIDGCRVRDVDLRTGALVCVGGTTLRVEATRERAFLELSTARSFGELRGSSRQMRRVYAVLGKAAASDATVLITGETGTGKEVAAQALHDGSRRAQAPFVAIDCGAIPENLIESELFGHARGAFSGATSDRKGVLEEADGGTIFFDEIGELPMTMQPKLLRALETRQVRRVGTNQPRKIDVRVIAATNRSLARSINEGGFREDLYYRLAVIEIELPSLRARREDIPELTTCFVERFTGRKDPVPPELMSALMTRDWPGNVRELRNFVERSLSLGWPNAGALEMAPAHVGTRSVAELVPTHLTLKEARLSWMAQFESVYVKALLEKTGGNVTRAAQLAGVTRRFFQRTMARNGVRSTDHALDDED